MPPRLNDRTSLPILKVFMRCAHQLGVGFAKLQLTMRTPTWLGLTLVLSNRSLHHASFK